MKDKIINILLYSVIAYISMGGLLKSLNDPSLTQTQVFIQLITLSW